MGPTGMYDSMAQQGLLVSYLGPAAESPLTLGPNQNQQSSCQPVIVEVVLPNAE